MYGLEIQVYLRIKGYFTHTTIAREHHNTGKASSAASQPCSNPGPYSGWKFHTFYFPKAEGIHPFWDFYLFLPLFDIKKQDYHNSFLNENKCGIGDQISLVLLLSE